MTGETPHYSWAIVGAGPHGCHLAVRLLDAKKARPEQIVLLDPHPPLYLWNRRTENVAMPYLRSSMTHHLGPGSADLERFARRLGSASVAWSGRYRCPSWPIFQAHCRHIVDLYELRKLWQSRAVSGLTADGHRYRLQTFQGELTADRVVLALGQPMELSWPSWIPRSENIFHLLDPEFRLSQIPGAGDLCVLGRGMSAAQAALHFCQERKVDLLVRGNLKLSDFDFPAGRSAFEYSSLAKHAVEKRSRSVREARAFGTVNARVKADLLSAQRHGRLSLRVAQEGDWSPTEDLAFRWGDIWYRPAAMLLGTGFQQPSSRALTETIRQALGLPVSPCGLPLTNGALEWAPRLYLTGGLAELAVGPTARNILGARHAATAILKTVGG
jgi:hypothetical protein